MSARKPRFDASGHVPPLRQLKLRPAAERQWAFQLGEQMSSQQARAEIAARLGIRLNSDSSYSEFRSWQLRQQVWDRANTMMEQDEDNLLRTYPNLDHEKIRRAALLRAYALADAIGEVKPILDVVTRGQVESELELKSRRLKLLEDKARERDQAAQVVESALSPEEKQQRLREIFGIK